MQAFSLIILSTVASASAATVLHLADDRAGAAVVVPILWTWGFIAIYGHRRDIWSPRTVLLAAALVRLPLIGTPWLLSDDAWRYLWEGRVLGAGLDPFAVAPATLQGLDDALRSRVNHPEMTSIYPPVALLGFRALDLLGGAPWLAQLLAAAADVATAAALIRLGGTRAGAAWALLPVAAIESAGSAHLEAPALAATAWAMVAVREGRGAAALAALTAGAGLKVLPALAAWPVLRALPRGQRLVGALLALGALVALTLLQVSPRPEALASLRAYGGDWSFDPLVLRPLEVLLAERARPLLQLAGAAVVAHAWVTGTSALETWRRSAAAFVLLSPTVHPWYVLWAVVPDLALGGWGWAAASTAMAGSYLVLLSWDPATASWEEPAWLGVVTWGPALLALALSSRSVVNPTSVYPTPNSDRKGTETHQPSQA